MEYISVKKIAKMWGIDTSRVGRLAREGRILGAKLVGHNWLIPYDAEKPMDKRCKNYKNFSISLEEKNFRFPSFAYASIDSFYPPLTDEEKTLREVELLVMECRFDDAIKTLGSLPINAKNRYCRIGALYYACIISYFETNIVAFNDYLSRITFEFKEDFPFKKEMEILYFMIFCNYGESDYFIKKFTIDPTYHYHKTSYPIMLSLSAYSMLISNIQKISDIHFSGMEINCQILENENRFEEAQSIHISLMILYFLNNDINRSQIHANHILRIAYDHKLYFLPASYIPYFKECFTTAFAEFPVSFVKTITELSDSIHDRFLRYALKANLINLYSQLPKRYFPFLNFSLMDFSNKQIAYIMGMSESTVNNRYSEIYDILGIKGKSELRKYYINTLIAGGSN